MDLRDLRYFETIAKLEHMGKASKQLHRTQPALTSCIRRLEADFGAPLFEKSGRGIRLTFAGHTLLKWAQRLRCDAEDARKEMGAIGHGMAGHVRIGIVPTAGQFLLPAAARQLLQEAPELTLHTTVGLIDTLKPLLLGGAIEVMLGTESPTEPGYTTRLLATDDIVVAASGNHPVFRSKPSLKALTEYRWALQPPGAPTRDWLDHTFDRKHLPRPRVQVETSMLLLLPALIVQTGLLTFISRHQVGAKGQYGLKEVPLRDATMRRRLVVVYRENSYLSPGAQRLIDLLTPAK
jgi:DNA-binding transcriptional LysR family regulator